MSSVFISPNPPSIITPSTITSGLEPTLRLLSERTWMSADPPGVPEVVLI